MTNATRSSLLKPRNLLNELDSVTFPEFVQRVLSIDYPGLKAFGPVKDGGIDLVADHPDHGRTVFQCKFLTGANPRPAASWRDERRKFGHSLALNAEGLLGGEAQYQPWLNTEFPIKAYVFCHNVSSVNLKGQDQIRTQSEEMGRDISHFFKHVIGKRSGFEHLAELKAKVLSGDALTMLCEGQPELKFRIFGSALPPGTSPLEDPLPDRRVSNFSQYLSEQRLPYFSRSVFKGARPDCADDFLEEAELLEKVFSTPVEDPVFLITGPGGYGKTRITLELCRLAQETRGAFVFRLSEEAGGEQVEDLFRTAPAAPLLLLVDYLETQRSFEQIVSAAANLNRRFGADIRIVANCRASYYKLEVADERPDVLDLTSTSTDTEFEFRRETFFHILAAAGFGRSIEFGVSCSHNPVLAALVLYLTEESTDRSDIIPELRTLIEDATYRKDLSTWLLRRLLRSATATIGPTTVGKLVQSVTPLMTLLPMHSRDMATLQQDPAIGPFITLLKHDRLIESREIGEWGGPQRWVATHDVIADYFLTRFLESTPSRDDALTSIFRTAEQLNLVRNAMIAIQRVAENRSLSGFPWADFLAAKVRDGRPAWIEAQGEMLRTILLDPREKLDLIERTSARWANLESEPRLDKHFARLAVAYRRWHSEYDGAPIPYNAEILLPFLNAACARDTTYSTLSRAVRYNPKEFADKIQQAIHRSSLTIDMHYLLVGWLQAGLSLDEIWDVCLAWLGSEFGSSDKSQFLLHAILDHALHVTKDQQRLVEILQSLQPFLRPWMDGDIRTRLFETRFVYGAWLRVAARAGKGSCNHALSLLTGPMQEWVRRHGSQFDAQYLMSSWMRAAHVAGKDAVKAALASLRTPIEEWLRNGDYVTKPAASIICSAWLMAARSSPYLAREAIETLRPYLGHWIEAENGTAARDAYLFHDWLAAANKAGVDFRLQALDTLRPHIGKWLEPDWRPATAEAEFIYTGWLGVAVMVDGATRLTAAGFIEPFVLPLLKEPLTGSRRIILGLWNKATSSDPGPFEMEKWWDRLWTVVRDLRKNREPATIQQASKNLWEISSDFRLPLGLSRAARGNFLFQLIRIFEEIVEFEALLPALSSFLFKIAEHPDLVGDPLPAGGRLRPTHLILLENALAETTEGEDWRGLRRVVRYFISLRPNELLRDAVIAKLQDIHSSHGHAALWEDIDLEAICQST